MRIASLEREQRVGGALRRSSVGTRMLLDERRPARATSNQARSVGRQLAGGRAAGERRGDVRVQAARLRAVGRRRRSTEQRSDPAALDRLLLVERGEQRVPGDRRGDRVDALVDRRGDELDPARVGDAVHADPRVARLVELRLGLLGEPVDQRRDVAALDVLGVDA